MMIVPAWMRTLGGLQELWLNRLTLPVIIPLSFSTLARRFANNSEVVVIGAAQSY